MRLHVLYILICVTVVQRTCAQNNTSPYSIIGIGDIESSSFDRSAGMANSGISLSSGRYLYHTNPASYSKLADHFFTMEVSGRYNGISYSGDPVSSSNYSSTDFQVKKIALAVKIKSYWGISAGLLPFSTSSYSFYANKSVVGTSFLNNTYYQGSGGLNQYYLANAFNITKNLSIGLQTTYLSGSFLQTETMDSVSLGTSLNTTRNIFMSKLYVKAGLLYQGQLTKKWKIGVGATASNKTTLNADYSLDVVTGGTTVVNDESIKSSYFTIPVMYAGGISFIHNNNLTFAGDYQFQNWNSVKYSGLGYVLTNSSRISGGVEYVKNDHYLQNYWERYNLQAGFYYENSYLDINGQQLKNYGITVGVGFSNRSNQLGYQFNIGVGQRGTTQNGLIKENYVQFGIILSYRDFWATKMDKFY